MGGESSLSRVLAVFRVLLAAAILADLALWLPDFGFFFTNSGVLTLSGMVTDTQVGRDAFSLYNSCTYAIFPYLLFLATAIAAVALMVGYRCDLAAPALWVLELSLQNRVAIALDAWDCARLITLSAGLLMPWDRAWALRPSPRRAGHGWVAGLLLLAVWGATLLPHPGWVEDAAAFFALGPRAHPTADYWYVLVGVNKEGRRWNLHGHGDREPEFSRASSCPLGDSYREQLYLAGLRQDRNWGLRYWLAFRYFVDLGDRVRSVEVYQCQASGHRLFARWPMHGEIPPQGSATSPGNGG